MPRHASCTICGCVCDDLRITVDRGRITKTEGACRLAVTLHDGGFTEGYVEIIDVKSGYCVVTTDDIDYMAEPEPPPKTADTR
jgi:formylmethanofuran dehydrogenase subunit B